MRSHARVVVVGGGIMGAGLLYHLAHEGWSESLLIEKAELTSGSTWHAAGQITHSTSHFGLGRCVGYGIDLYQRLEAETGQSVTWHGCGSLRLAYTEHELDWLRHTLGVGAALGHRMELVTPARIRELHPFYNTDGVLAALHTPDDGHLDPAGATFALAAGARRLGAQVIRQNRVLDIRAEPNGEWRVVTEQGDVVCEHVVNAGGTYARQVGRWLGLDLPITCMTHHYLVTERVPQFADLEHELPVVRDDRKVSGYVRQEQQAGLIGIYEKANPNAVWLDGTPWAAEHELFEPDYERIAPWLEAALERMPVLAEVGIKRTVHGAITHPPDGNPLIGPAPGLRNVWLDCGCQIGVGWGPGLTRELARWMVHGECSINMREFDPRRYGAFADAGYAVTKAHEDYLLRHEIPYPGLNRLAGRPVKTSGVYARLQGLGAVFEEVYGWERPRWFARDGLPATDIYGFRRNALHAVVAAEVRAVRERVGVMDISAFAKLRVAGAAAATFLDRLIPNRLPRREGGMVLTHLLNEAGRIEAEVTLFRTAPQTFYLTAAAFFEQRVYDHLQAHLRDHEQVLVENLSQGIGALALQGPQAREVLRGLTRAPLDNASFPWLTAREIEVAGVKLLAMRVSYSGEQGYELHVPMDDLERVFDALWEAGGAHGIAPYGSFAMNALRMEKGFMGASELTNEVTLPEAGVMRFVRMDKGEFLGRAATGRALEQPLRWRCAQLAVETEDDCLGGEPVFANGTRVGVVSAGAFGHHVGASLAFAYLAPAAAAPDTVLEVMVLGERRPARVLGAPLHDPDNLRPRA